MPGNKNRTGEVLVQSDVSLQLEMVGRFNTTDSAINETFTFCIKNIILYSFSVCTTPPDPANGKVDADGVLITYTCDLGYTLSEDQMGFCTNNGSGWSIQTPTCGIFTCFQIFTNVYVLLLTR